ncbi:hypothetical protein AB0M46_13240 [Dactylosporangium sp. NPDC051485]|uniref:hypothetical protein n=1 Tax=Dactylosporangium sp. NPDC051485 TaxID=3154846 RepID=UPI003414C168
MTDQFDHLLHNAFDDFAAAERSTAEQAPGTAAVRRTVAVQRRNRYSMLGLLGAVLIAIPVAAYAANPRGNNSPPLPGTSVAASNSPSATASASPTPSEGATAASTAASTDPVPGMYLYRVGNTTDDLLHRAPGGDWRKITTVKGPTPAEPMTMSPDHQHIAWVLDGKLQISALDGSKVKTVVAATGTLSCSRVTWAADSRHLLFQAVASGDKGTTLETVNIDGTGRKTLGTATEGFDCGLGSVDGATGYVVSRSGKKHLVAFDGSGAPRTVRASWPSGWQPNEVVAAANGSTRLLVAIVSDSASCGCSPPQQYVIVDTATGQVTRLDNAQDKEGSAPISGAFTADGRVVLIADRNRGNGTAVDPFLTVFSAGGAILGSVRLPDIEYGYLAGFDA